MSPPRKNPWFVRLYDPLMAPLEWLVMRRTRRSVVSDAEGLVLEIGAGTGLNLPHYRRARRVVAFDADPAMLRQGSLRARQAAVPVNLVVADAQSLPFPDGVFDTVVATCVLCTIPDPEAAFREIRRVLKPAGEVRLLEHVRAPSPRVARLQDRLTPLWSRIAGGCRLNRKTLESARRAGFTVELIRARFGGVVLHARLHLSGKETWPHPR
ncbi:MAG: class I SAM-dependent methyltransferase [Actinomycetota bacterium]